MAKRKPKRETPATPAPLPPATSDPTEDDVRAERIAEIGQLPYVELTERIGDGGLPVADAEGSFVRPQPAPPLTEDQQRVVLVKKTLADKIHLLSVDSPPDYFQMILAHNHDGSPKGPIVVNASQYMPALAALMPIKWKAEEVRDLWQQSAKLIPGATVVESEPDAGFTLWLWANTQRAWTAALEMGYAINPYTMWLSGIATGCAGEQVVSSNPQLATAIDISLVAGHAKRLAVAIPENAEAMADTKKRLIECMSLLNRLRKAAQPKGPPTPQDIALRKIGCTPKSGPFDTLTPQELQLQIEETKVDVEGWSQDYRRLYLIGLRLQQWLSVVRLYAGAFAKEIATQRTPLVNLENLSPSLPVDVDGLSSYLNRIAVELADFANTMATESRLNTQNTTVIPDDKLMTGREHAGNELNFEFPAKTPNEAFRLADLNRALKRLLDCLQYRVPRGYGDPEIRWSQSQWTDDYWPYVRREMQLTWARLPEDSREIYDYGKEYGFEQLEDHLCDLKFQYFEGLDFVPHCVVDDNRHELLRCAADVLKEYPEPNQTRVAEVNRGSNAPLEGDEGQASRVALLGSSSPSKEIDEHLADDDDAGERERPDATTSHMGISLLDAALVLNEFDSTLANETKERWKKHRTKPPEPLGKAANHKQTDLYDPERLRDEYLAIVEADLSSAFTRKAYKGKLRPVRKPGKPGAKSQS